MVRARPLALALALIASAAWGDTEPVRPKPGPRSYLLPALEAGALNFGLLAVNNAAGQEYGLVTWRSVWGAFDGSRPWTFDQDDFVVNQLGHPYQGMLVHSAARSAGLNFWEAGAYTFFSSLAWELFFEPDAPSINDQITTALGGALLGEALHRLYRALVDVDGPGASSLRELAASLLSPASAMNRWLFDDRFGQVPSAPRGLYARVALGVGAGPRLLPRTRAFSTPEAPPLQGALTARFVYGGAAAAKSGAVTPMEHWELDLSGGAPISPMLDLHLLGLIAGRGIRDHVDTVRALWGLYGQYDLAWNDVARVSGVGLGLGFEADAKVGTRWSLQAGAVASVLGAAASGLVDAEEGEGRDYLLGPGTGLVMQARAIRHDVGMVGASLRRWRVAGVWAAPIGRYEATTYVEAEAAVMLGKRWVLGLQAPVAVQRTQQAGGGNVFASDGLRLTLGLASDGGFGASR